ncbi:hypothetical protein JW859_10375 [bacterium]|nr:hypothetical protein [bacterium]
MGLTRLLVTGAACVCLFSSGCELVAQIDARAYREFHAACWQATVQAYVAEQDEVELPAEPPAPRVCEDTVIPAYHGIIAAAQEERAAWYSLRCQSQTSLEFAAEMLEVLTRRDTANIELLAPQIEGFHTAHQAERQRWREAYAGIARAVAELESAWTEVWPEQDLEFDLAGTAAALREELTPAPDAERTAALQHYYDNEYNRLAMIYLGFEPETLPNPESHVPTGCDELSLALKRLEAALLVRYSMDQAIEQDVLRIQELARVDLTETPWDEIQLPQGRYAKPRVSASIARLKLLKYLDALVVDGLDVILRDVDLHWREIWPQHKLETNIFAFAGLARVQEQNSAPVVELPRDPIAEFTFRQ